MIVVGIDSAKNRVDAVAMKFETGEMFSRYSLDLGTSKVRQRDVTLKTLKLGIWEWIIDELKRYDPDVILYIEAAIMVRNVQVAVALAETVGMLLALPYPAFTVPIDSWKKELSKSGLSKEEVKSIVSGRFPAESTFFDDRQDLFDATGVAVYGLADQELRGGLGTGTPGYSLGG